MIHFTFVLMKPFMHVKTNLYLCFFLIYSDFSFNVSPVEQHWHIHRDIPF